MIKILIADDHAVVREGLKRILEENPEIEVVGEASTGHEAVQLTHKLSPDIVLLDLSMPERSGIDALGDIRSAQPRARILILSMHPEEQYAIRCLREGADGYLTKESAPDLLLDAIGKLSMGKKYVSASLAETLAVNLFSHAEEQPHERLSDRELEVLIMIGKGRTVSQFADELCLSAKTISTYRSRILEKMSLDNNAQLMRYSIDNGLT